MKTQTLTTTIGRTELQLTVQSNTHPSPFLLRLHGDEREARQTGQWWVEQYGGSFLDVENTSRHIAFDFQHQHYQFDPNRVFSDEGIAYTLKKEGFTADETVIAEVRKFSTAFAEQCKNTSEIIALHNNQNFNINFYLPGGECEGTALDIHINAEQHPHDLILVNALDDFNALKAHNINTVLQDAHNADYPGSFSDYCFKHNIRYFNIETYQGHLAQQKKLLRLVVDIL